MRNPNTELFICDCSHVDHSFVVRYYDEEDPHFRFLCIDVIMAGGYGFFERLWLALKYIFGWKSPYGHFTEILLAPEEVGRLRDVLGEVLQKWGKGEESES